MVYDGEVNFVVAARDALSCARNYLEDLKDMDQDAASCAGIAVFHGHSPYADAYRIAEECCETGKKLMKEKGMERACFIDFHLIQGAVGTSLKEIRQHEGTEDASRPWLVDADGEIKPGITTMEEVDRLAELFNEIGRTNVKILADAAKNSQSQLLLELLRISAHLGDNHEETKKKIKRYTDNLKDSKTKDATAKLIYDVVISYDLWFKKGEGKMS